MEKLPSFLTVSECLEGDELEPKRWMAIFIKISDLISKLHEKGLSLCVPIERCMFIDVKNEDIVLFYIQSVEALNHHFSKLNPQQQVE